MVQRTATVENTLIACLAAWAGSARAVSGSLTGYTAALLLLTHWPRVPELNLGGSVLPLPLDKIIHGGLYALLGFLANFANRAGVFRLRLSAPALLAATGLFAALDEATQSLTGRSPDGWDWVANLVGAACGIGLARITEAFIMPRAGRSQEAPEPCDPIR